MDEVEEVEKSGGGGGQKEVEEEVEKVEERSRRHEEACQARHHRRVARRGARGRGRPQRRLGEGVAGGRVLLLAAAPGCRWRPRLGLRPEKFVVVVVVVVLVVIVVVVVVVVVDVAASWRQAPSRGLRVCPWRREEEGGWGCALGRKGDEKGCWEKNVACAKRLGEGGGWGWGRRRRRRGPEKSHHLLRRPSPSHSLSLPP